MRGLIFGFVLALILFKLIRLIFRQHRAFLRPGRKPLRKREGTGAAIVDGWRESGDRPDDRPPLWGGRPCFGRFAEGGSGQLPGPFPFAVRLRPPTGPVQRPQWRQRK